MLTPTAPQENTEPVVILEENRETLVKITMQDEPVWVSCIHVDE